MTPQPISARPSADSSPVMTPSNTPPAFLSHGFEAKMQNFLPSFDGASGSGLARGWHEEEIAKGKADAGSTASSRSESNISILSSELIVLAPSFSAQRPTLPFFSNLTSSRPQPLSYAMPSHAVGMAKTSSSSGSSDSSTTSMESPVPGSLPRTEPKRAATLPMTVAGFFGMEKRHYDPSREPKLLHFM